MWKDSDVSGGKLCVKVSFTPGETAPYLVPGELALNAADGLLYFVDETGASASVGVASVAPVALAYAETVATDASLGDIFDLTLTGNVTLSNPTNPVNGKTIRWRISQDNVGSHTVALGDKFNIPSSGSDPLPWSTAADACDILAATYHADRDQWDVVAFVPGY